MNNSEPTLFLGLDIGGTSTAGVYQVLPGGPTVTLLKKGLNLKVAGIEAVCALIVEIADEVRAAEQYGGELAICAGVAGAGSPDDQDVLSARFQSMRPGDHLRVVADSTIALEGAFESESGVLCICGTGSNVCLRDRTGRVFSAGGWGRLLGDPASAYQLGMDCLREIAAHIDEHGSVSTSSTERDMMLDTVAREFSITNREAVIEFVYSGTAFKNRPVTPATIAPFVVSAAEKGDSSAQRIVTRGICDFTGQIRQLVDRVYDVEHRFVLMGGLFNSGYFSAQFLSELHSLLPESIIHQPSASAEFGALRLAKRILD